MSEWKQYKLGDITNVIDCPHSTPKWTDEGIFVIRSWNVRNGRLNFNKVSFTDEQTYQDRIRRAAPKCGDIVLTREAPMGEVCLIPQDLKCCLGQRVVLLQTKNIVDSKFLLYSLLSPTIQQKIKANEGTGSTVSNFRIPDIKTLEIFAPQSNETQSQIASILSSFDDKIEVNLQMNQTLETMAQAIFKEWFVNYNFPGFDGELVDGLPKGWKMGKLNALVKILSGFAFKSIDFDDEGEYKLVTIKNVQDGKFDTQITDRLSSIPEKMPEYCLLSEGDILLSLTGNVGRICIVTGEKFLLNQRVAKLEPLNERDRAFTYFVMRSSVMKERLISISRGTAQQNLSPIETGRLEFVVPDNSVLANYSEVVTSLFEKTIENINEINTLTQIRDSLLPKLMTGKIRIQA